MALKITPHRGDLLDYNPTEHERVKARLLSKSIGLTARIEILEDFKGPHNQYKKGQELLVDHSTVRVAPPDPRPLKRRNFDPQTYRLSD